MFDTDTFNYILSHKEVPASYEAKQPAQGNYLSSAYSHALGLLVKTVGDSVSGLDWAILVRQCLRRLPKGWDISARALTESDFKVLNEVGVVEDARGFLSAIPFCPNWVSRSEQGYDVDLVNADNHLHEGFYPGENWLSKVDKTSWKSLAQKEAVWLCLKASGNSTHLIGLPTGSGKSLIFQCLASLQSGLTVLVVPTTALGMDQLEILKDMTISRTLRPSLYTSDANAEQIIDEINSRRCRLLISSPEAIVSGRLFKPLAKQAEEGFLTKFVVDEAHIIESWGAEFRVEFQLLGSVLKKWRMSSPSGITTVLLSATFAPSTSDVLRDMFKDANGTWEERVVQQLRPEIHYFRSDRPVSNFEREARVKEALLNLPRPLILYATKIEDVDHWGSVVRDLGFRRFRTLHGNTPAKERREIVEKWRRGELDMVVGNSAFGMGIDKPDVRSIVHACLPEGIDRFYQEVGRGGRDGFPTISLLVQSLEDEAIAVTNRTTLLRDPRKIQERWNAIWGSRESQSDLSFIVRKDVRPSYRVGEVTGEEDVRWNQRLLLLMQRAGLIRIEDLVTRVTDTGEVSESGEVKYENLLRITLFKNSEELRSKLPELLEQDAEIERGRGRESFNTLKKYVYGKESICRLLRNHWGEETIRACGSCEFCRTNPSVRKDPKPLEFRSQSILTSPRIFIVEFPSLDGPASSTAITESLRQVLNTGLIEHFFFTSRFPFHEEALRNIFKTAEPKKNIAPYRIDNISYIDKINIQENANIVVFHHERVDDWTSVANQRGKSVSHWMIGFDFFTVDGAFPYMRENGDVFTGRKASADWIEFLLNTP